MTDILGRFADLALTRFAPGAPLIGEGELTGRLYLLRSGTVDVVREGVTVARVDSPGAIFGEMALLLERPHSAEVRAVTEVQAHVVEDGLDFLAAHPDLALHVTMLLARRLQNTTALLVEIRDSRSARRPPRRLFERLFAALAGHGPPPGAQTGVPVTHE